MRAMPAPKTRQKRTREIKVRVLPEVGDKLQAAADAVGQTPAVLASIAVSQYVDRLPSRVPAN